jgi:ABC-type multidrug transport system fused ATPase/permease subunit
LQSLVDLEDFIHMLREPPQPQEGSVPHLPDWPLPPEHPGSSSGSGSGGSSIGDGTSSSSSGVSISGNGAGPAGQHTKPAGSLHSQLSCSKEGSAATEHTANAVPVSSSFPAQAAISQQSISACTLGRRHQAGLHVEFRDVSFRYSQSAGADRAQEDLWASADLSAVESPAAAATLAVEAPMQLQGITFALQPGEALGIVGPPGK